MLWRIEKQIKKKYVTGGQPQSVLAMCAYLAQKKRNPAKCVELWLNFLLNETLMQFRIDSFHLTHEAVHHGTNTANLYDNNRNIVLHGRCWKMSYYNCIELIARRYFPALGFAAKLFFQYVTVLHTVLSMALRKKSRIADISCVKQKKLSASACSRTVVSASVANVW